MSTPIEVYEAFDAKLTQICELGHDPHILVNTKFKGVIVPSHVTDKDSGFVVLNLRPGAVRDYYGSSEGLSFEATFGGRRTSIFVPMGAILKLYDSSKASFTVGSGEKPEPEEVPRRKFGVIDGGRKDN